MSHDLATKLIVGNFVKICGSQKCSWYLKFEEYWDECDQLSDTCYYPHYIAINLSRSF